MPNYTGGLGISPSVLPRPSEWGDHVHLTGYWFLPAEGAKPSEELRAFVAAGDPPVFVGFGSIAGRDPEETAGIVLEAVRRAGVRAVLASGWGGLSVPDPPEDVLLVGDEPFGWLFPRVASVVHHGGTGTTAEGLRAGCPTVVAPSGGDQPFWGRRVERLGVGLAPLPRRKLSAERLAVAIRTTLDDGRMRERAGLLGEKIRSEDGVGETIALIERGTVRR